MRAQSSSDIDSLPTNEAIAFDAVSSDAKSQPSIQKVAIPAFFMEYRVSLFVF
jgi:hypothetical protein